MISISWISFLYHFLLFAFNLFDFFSNLDYWFENVHFSDINIFPSQYCCSCIPQIYYFVVSLSNLVLWIFKIPFEICSCTHRLFGSGLFYFQDFGDLLVVSLLLISSWFHYGQRTYMYDFNPFIFVKVCFMTQHMVYLSICCSMATWKECVFCCYWVDFYKCHLDPVGWSCSVFLYVFANFLFRVLLVAERN